MKTMEFDAPFGNEMKKVKLMGNDHGGSGYQVLIDRYNMR